MNASALLVLVVASPAAKGMMPRGRRKLLRHQSTVDSYSKWRLCGHPKVRSTAILEHGGHKADLPPTSNLDRPHHVISVLVSSGDSIPPCIMESLQMTGPTIFRSSHAGWNAGIRVCVSARAARPAECEKKLGVQMDTCCSEFCLCWEPATRLSFP